MCVAPVGLTGYGLAAGEVAEQTLKGLLCSFTPCLRGFPVVTSYSGTVANGPTGINGNHVNQDLEMGPAGRLGDQGHNGT